MNYQAIVFKFPANDSLKTRNKTIGNLAEFIFCLGMSTAPFPPFLNERFVYITATKSNIRRSMIKISAVVILPIARVDIFGYIGWRIFTTATSFPSPSV